MDKASLEKVVKVFVNDESKDLGKLEGRCGFPILKSHLQQGLMKLLWFQLLKKSLEVERSQVFIMPRYS